MGIFFSGGNEADSFIQLSQEEATWWTNENTLEQPNYRYMSIVPILNMLGSVAAYPMGEWLGRKKVLVSEITKSLRDGVISFLFGRQCHE